MLYHWRHFDQAVGRAEKGLRGIDSYLKLEPNDARARGVALQLHGNRALSLFRLGKYGEAAADWARVTELSGQPLPSGNQVEFALNLFLADKRSAALEQASRIESSDGIDPVFCYNLGCLYSVCAAEAKDDLRIPAGERDKLVESRISEALRWLKAAAAAGFFGKDGNRDHAKSDTDLQILRDRVEFRQLVDQGGGKK